MQYQLVCNLKPYIKPFERVLAMRELSAVAGVETDLGTELSASNKCFVRSEAPQTELCERLAYWDSVSISTGNQNISTNQIKLEATSLVPKSIAINQLRKSLPFTKEVPSVNRRNLRYGPHGIHEYRGKFFPQLVKALLNIAKTNRGSTVLDPMCGSGTTLLEASLLGCHSIGIDLNPLSVLISESKSNILKVKPQELERLYDGLVSEIDSARMVKTDCGSWFKTLSTADIEYLNNWFSPSVLNALNNLVVAIQNVKDVTCRRFFLVALSNIIREVSHQKVDDLRVRKEANNVSADSVYNLFLKQLEKNVRSVVSFQYQISEQPLGTVDVIEGDVRNIHKHLQDHLGKIDAIVTSPPYATALPYLDTDRLSLYFLGLLSRPDHKTKDLRMVGNREVSNKQRDGLWEYYCENRNLLTERICDLIDHIYTENNKNNVGFRRRNLPALLAKYFFDMRDVLSSFKLLLKPNAPAYLVVGNNHTNSGGERIEIVTDDLLAELGASVGLIFEEKLDMLISRDLFRKTLEKRSL